MVANTSNLLDEPAAALLDELAVELQLSALAQVLDDVPVELADVLAAYLRQAVPEREVDGAVDLLVEERVLHVLGDPRIAADPELAEPPGSLVEVEHLEQERLVRIGRGVHDLALPASQPAAWHL